MNEASVNLLKQNNGMKEIFSNNFFLSTFQSYHPLRENAPVTLMLWTTDPQFFFKAKSWIRQN